MTLSTLLLLLLLSSTAGFMPSSRSNRCCNALPAATKKDDDFHPFGALIEKKNVGSLALAAAAASIFAAAVIGSAEPAVARNVHGFYTDVGGSTELLAARSGGRAGGRSSSSYRSSSPRRSAAPAPPTRVYNSNTIIRPSYSPPIIVSPGFGFGYSPFFNPFGGFGLGFGGNNVFQDIRQDNEIDRVRAELQAEKIKEAEIEARIRSLEGSASTTQQKLQAQPAAPATSQ